ncbi:hypothetical protein BKA61DRAFT_663117 [Leptodontidium sp. MPI-SDFR-AT-0119]|nr:hypothetical protein BKA61DRAFT_663117 [Leptodontidium sp. MPI-SDFR-AT-0119]
MASLRSLSVAFLLSLSFNLFSTALCVATVQVADAELAPPVLPSSGNLIELPIPSLSLKYIAVGRGVQNYTCITPDAAPVAIGAIAKLYDATDIAYTSTTLLHMFPPLAVTITTPHNPSTSLRLYSKILKPLGHHFFDAAGTPIFDLHPAGEILFATKIQSVKAPATASKGPAGTGAVDWLYLGNKTAGYTSIGLRAVYRVVTAGGISPGCSSAGESHSVDYAAEYWFYE